MNFEKFTIKSQEALQKAAGLATSNDQQAIELFGSSHYGHGIFANFRHITLFADAAIVAECLRAPR